MKFDLRQEFPVGLERLWTALGRAAYVEQKYRALGSTSLRILKFSASPELIEVELDREAPVDGKQLPVWARVFSGKAQAMHQKTRWKRADPSRIEAEVDISAVRVLVSAKGVGSVVEVSPVHSRMTLHFHVSSASPILKSKVARLFAQQVKSALADDHEFTVDYLRRSAHQ